MAGLLNLNRKINSYLVSTKRRRVTTMFVAMVAAFAILWVYSRITIVESWSLPYTIYWLDVHPDRNTIRKGTYVRFKLHYYLYHEKNNDAIKRVACIPGEKLVVDKDKNYYCGEKWLGKAKDYTLKGEKLNNFVFNGVIPENMFFVVADHKDSLDSRYIGFVPREQVQQIAHPII